MGLAVDLPRLDARKMLATMMHDKKVQHGKLRLVLPSRLGHADVVEDVPAEEVRQALKA